MTEKKNSKQQQPAELKDEALDQTQGGLGDTLTHEVGHWIGIVSPRDPASGLPTGKR